MLPNSSSLQVDDPRVFAVIGGDECQRSVTMLHEDITGQGHLEPWSHVDSNEQGAYPVAIAINARPTLGEIQDSPPCHPKHLSIIRGVYNRQTPIFRHSQARCAFPFEGVSLSIRPTRKLHTFPFNIWLNIRALIYRPIHFFFKSMRQRLAIVTALLAPRKHFVLSLFSIFGGDFRHNPALFLFGFLFERIVTIFGFVNKKRLKINHLVDSKAIISVCIRSTVGKRDNTELSTDKLKTIGGR